MIEAWLPQSASGHGTIAVVVALLIAPLMMRRNRQGAFDLVVSYCSAFLLALTIVFALDIVLTATAEAGLEGLRSLDRDSFLIVLPFIVGGLCIEMVRKLDGPNSFATATAAVLLTAIALVADRALTLAREWLALI